MSDHDIGTIAGVTSSTTADRLAAIPILLVALSKLIRVADEPERQINNNKPHASTFRILVYTASAVSFLLLKQPTAIGTVIVWGPLTRLLSSWLSQWTRAVKRRKSDRAEHRPSWIQGAQDSVLVLVHGGGPLGPGCAKVVEVLAATFLWNVTRGQLPPAVVATFSAPWHVLSSRRVVVPADSNSKDENGIHWMVLILGIVLLALAVNGVLAAWSYFCARSTTSRAGRNYHTHSGVQSMVASTLGRKLSGREHAGMMLLAIVNATCEECTARGFWRHEFECTASASRHWSNAGHAILFGAWHYYGIPSGWTGVGLTTVYGWIMGLLADLYPSTGMLLPILAHSIADYYIFAVIARQQKKNGD